MRHHWGLNSILNKNLNAQENQATNISNEVIAEEIIDAETGEVFIEKTKKSEKKNQKPNLQNPDGGIVTRSMPLDISNVAFVDPSSRKATRLGFKVEADSKKVRFAKASGNLV